MPMGLGLLGLGLGRQLLSSWSFVSGGGISLVSIVPSGANWLVTLTDGSTTHSATFTTAELNSNVAHNVYPPPPSGPTANAFSVPNAGWWFWPSYLTPMNFAVDWYLSGVYKASGLSWDSTGTTITGFEVKAIITPTYGSAISVIAQAAAAFTETLVQSANWRLSNSSLFAANSPITVVSTFITDTTVGSSVPFQGNTGYSSPAIYWDTNGQLTIFLSADGGFYRSSVGFLVASTRYTIFASLGSTDFRVAIKTGSAAPVVVANTTGAYVPYSMAVMNGYGNWQGGGNQFTGKLGRIFVAPYFIDFAQTGNQDAFVNSAGSVINPAVGRALVASYGVDMCDTLAAWNAGTNPGTFGNLTKVGTAFT